MTELLEGRSSPWGLDPWGERMLAPDEVAQMVRLHQLGWGTRRIAGELGCSRNTVKRYLAAGGWAAIRPARRRRRLDGLERQYGHLGRKEVRFRADEVRSPGSFIQAQSAHVSTRPRSEMAKLRSGDRRLAFIGADFVDDLQYALAIGAELHAEFRHDAAVVDHEVA